MILSVKEKLWNTIYYPIRDHLLENLPPGLDEREVRWIEQGFADMGIRLFNNGSNDDVWTHVDIPDAMVTELWLRWA